ncbi:hypothetical protein AgCh_001366 [Apium graveolens]
MNRTKLPICERIGNVLQFPVGVDAAEAEGVAFRGLFVIDKEWVIQHSTINNLAIVRSVDETIRFQEEFTKRYAGGKAATAVADSLNKEFGAQQKQQMQYCVDHPEEINKLAKVKAQVLELKALFKDRDEHSWYKRVSLLDSLLDYAGSDGFHSLP